jgi:hypothetical protein
MSSYNKQPCAYCGRREDTCHGGHVIPDCIYPLVSPVTRIKVPECHVCKASWEGDDARFRDVIVISGEANELADEKFFGPISRSFDKPSGHKWRRELRELLVPIEVDGVPRHKVYPLVCERVVRVLKRIVRGLCHKHEIGTCITEKQVGVWVQRWARPPDFHESYTSVSLGDGFCWYSYCDLQREDDGSIHSVWEIEFYGRTRFFCIVSASVDGWATPSLY